MRSHHVLSLLMFTPILGGGLCGGGEPPPPTVTECSSSFPDPGQETIEMGQLVDGNFVPLSDNDTLLMEFGPQGGQHLLVSTRLYAENGTEWVHELRLRDPATQSELGSRFNAIDACAPGWTVTHNITLFVDDPETRRGIIMPTSQQYEDNQVVRTVSGPQVTVNIEPPS